MFPLYFEWFLSYRENVSLLALLVYVLICTYTHVGICLRSAVEDYLNLIELELLTTLGSSVSASQHWADRKEQHSGLWEIQLRSVCLDSTVILPPEPSSLEIGSHTV